MLMDKSGSGLTISDQQSTSLVNRMSYISSNYTKKDKSEISDFYTQVSHILRPFVVDPVISKYCEPKANKVDVCVPFLNNDDREMEPNVFLKRPGLEFILRIRLKAEREQESVTIPSTYLDKLKELSNDENEKELYEVISNSSGIDELTINNLLKTIKGLLHIYISNIDIVKEVSEKVVWTPLCSVNGPDGGTKITSGYILPRTYLSTWRIDRDIEILTIKSSIAKSQADLGEGVSYSDFSISEFQTLSKDYDNRLDELKSSKNSIETKGSDALRTIEIINGEVSGFGLIDILVIYTALWTLDINVLLGLIDDESIERLYNIEDLRTGSVVSRKNKIGNYLKIQDAYNKLEERIIALFEYCDRVYDVTARNNSDVVDRGDVERN
jgi:hypothetical protein